MRKPREINWKITHIASSTGEKFTNFDEFIKKYINALADRFIEALDNRQIKKEAKAI